MIGGFLILVCQHGGGDFAMDFRFCYGFCSVEVGGVTEKLDGGGGGGGGDGWLRE